MSEELRILLAEDNPDDVFLLGQAFKRAGASFPVATLGDGWEVIEYFSRTGAFAGQPEVDVDVLLLDLNMPRRSGLEVLEWLRQQPRWRTLIVHVLSASSREEDVARAYELGANSYLVKPSRLDELVTLISTLQAWHRWVVPARRRVTKRGETVIGSGADQ
jgi:CheY-like chemotaxis protein